jgi:putative nucleotidyltransferase with HDIG domain
MSISRMLNQAKTPPGFSMERFNRHSAAVAMLSDMLAQRVKVNYPEGAFVGGLLHDIGLLLEAMALPTEFTLVLRRQHESGRPWVECELELLGFSHATLSAAALAEWKLPLEIGEAARDHHEPIVATNGPVPLAAVISAANQYVNSQNQAVMAQYSSTVPGTSGIETLGLTGEKLAALLDEFQTEHNALAQYFH